MDVLLEGWGVRTAAFIGAANPFSRRATDPVNVRQHRLLIAMLRHTPMIQGHGVGCGWSEPHVLAALSPFRAAVLGRRFRQTAIVTVALRRPARLVMLARAPLRPAP